jgi:NADPH:quinone reductase-like Zn-dependent oxidoreductase
MNAVQIERHSPSLDEVRVVDRERPSPGDGQVLVRMCMSPINPSDFNHIHGTYDAALGEVIWNRGEERLHYGPRRDKPTPRPPYVLGGEGVGIVEAAGSGWMARRLRGKRVAIAAGPPEGAWQGYTVVDARRAMPVPAGVPDEQAAMSFINPLTATIMVREILKVPPGAWLLQSAAGSALGKMVIRLGKALGFRTINVVRSDAHGELLRRLGADAVIDSSLEDVASEVHRLTGGQGVAHALDCVGGETAGRLIRCLGLDGHLVLYGTLSPDPISLPSRSLMMPVARVSGFFLPNWLQQQSPLRLLRILRFTKSLAARGTFATEVAEVFPLAQVRNALERASERGRTGKILLRIDGGE